MTTRKLPARQRSTFKAERPPKAKSPNYYKLEQYKALSYDYGEIDEQHRETVQEAALAIHKWQRGTLELGKTLLAVKEVLPHGQFVEWLKHEFDSGLRVLQQAMNVARLLKDNPKAHDYALLSADALYLLAAPSTPQTVRWYIQERIELTDWRPTRREIQQMIGQRKPFKPRHLTGPASEPEAIDAEYTVIQTDADLLLLALPRSLVRKLYAAALRSTTLLDAMTGDERDRLMMICQKALEGERE